MFSILNAVPSTASEALAAAVVSGIEVKLFFFG